MFRVFDLNRVRSAVSGLRDCVACWRLVCRTVWRMRGGSALVQCTARTLTRITQPAAVHALSRRAWRLGHFCRRFGLVGLSEML